MENQGWWKSFLEFWNWVYDKIAYITIAILALNTLLFFIVVPRGFILGIVDVIVLAVFCLRIWKEREGQQ
jgi:hypothetical protein